MKYLLMLLTLIFSSLASANDLDKIVGTYNYESYALTLGSGRVLRLGDIGAKSSVIEIRPDASVVMTMAMLSGKELKTTAHIKEIKIDGNQGYWIAQWPDMDYPVRKDFTLRDGTLEYTIKFENPADKQRYGFVEQAVLKKQN